jgi:hypothetical protein
MIDDMTKKILWSGVEDYSGFWEILWEFNVSYPDISDSQKRQKIVEIVEDLLYQGWLNLFWCKEPYGDLSIVNDEQAKELLSNPLLFDVPEEGEFSLRIRTTLLGSEAPKYR